jgi:hypothetical protein
MEELLPYRERRLAHARRGPAAAESGRDRGGLLTAREGPAAAESGRDRGGLLTAREGG